MDKEETRVLEVYLENLREEINKDVIEYIDNASKEGYKGLIDKSRKLDEVIVNYIRSSNKYA